MAGEVGSAMEKSGLVNGCKPQLKPGFRLWLVCCLSLIATICFLVPPHMVQAQAGKPWEEYVANNNSKSALKILFIGHSKMYINNMPKMFAYFAQQKAGAQPLKIYSVFGDAYSLQTHWQAGLARKAIKEQGPWDYVVLIEKSGLPESRRDIYGNYLALFDREIKAVHARTVLMENYTTPNNYDNMHSTMQSFKTLYKAFLMPVGTAFQAAYKEHPDISLLQSDAHHPNPKGTYLMACTCYAFFLRRNPCDLPAELYAIDDNDNTVNIFANDGESRALQRIAWQTVSSLWGKAR